MSFNLLESVKGYITPDLVSAATNLLGEQSSGVSKAIEAAVPALLQGVVNKGISDSGGLLDLAKQAAGSGLLDNVGGIFGNSSSGIMKMGAGILSSLFGKNANMLGNLIGSFAGIRPSSTTSLLSTLAPIALGVLGKHALTNSLGADGLKTLLSSQKDQIEKALPAGLDLSSLAASSSKVPVPDQEKTSAMPGWLIPLLVVVLGAMLLWYLLGKRNTEESKTQQPTLVEADTAVTTPPATTNAREMLKVELPGGTILDAYKGGIEDQLVSFLKDSTAAVSKDKWFDFDNLNFNTGTAEIIPESQAQINNIAAILKAFPKAKIKIGGYTDKTGDDAANMKLSKDRANAVRVALTTAGVGSQVIDAEGYGSKFAKAAADAQDEEKQKDRRVSVSVREK